MRTGNFFGIGIKAELLHDLQVIRHIAPRAHRVLIGAIADVLPQITFLRKNGEDERGLDAGRLEAVSARAVELGVLNCKGVASLLARKPDTAAAGDSRPGALFDHANLRGPGYYH